MNRSSRTRFIIGAGALVLAACKDSTGLPDNRLLDSTVTAPDLALVGTIPVPTYVHDSFVRDGLVFVCAWTNGLIIYDVGNGIRSGTASNPVEVGRVVTNGNGVSVNVHNAWWFHNPVTSEKKYVFVGQEGPSSIPTSSTGDIHVVDVSDMAHPVEVAFYHMSGSPAAGTHNFWMDEAAQILYAAYYNGGVVALNVSGTLSGDLASREIARYKPAPSTFMWGVQQVGTSLYATDMLNGFYQLKISGSTFSTGGGGGNVTERFSSDLWVTGQYAFTGTWGGTPRTVGGIGNALKIWALGSNGAPGAVTDSVIFAGISTVSDVKGSADGKLLVVSAEGGPSGGVYIFNINDPKNPRLVGRALVTTGIHTVKVADIGTKRYVFAAKTSGSPALQIYDITGL